MRAPYAKPGDRLHVPVITVWRRLRPFILTLDFRVCWPWQGGLSGPPPHRRGLLQIDGVTDSTPQWAWRAVHPHDPRPARLHNLCSTEACCNPRHYSASHARLRKLPHDALARIVAAHAAGETQQVIATRLGVTQQDVSYLLRRYAPRAER